MDDPLPKVTLQNEGVYRVKGNGWSGTAQRKEPGLFTVRVHDSGTGRAPELFHVRVREQFIDDELPEVIARAMARTVPAT